MALLGLAGLLFIILILYRIHRSADNTYDISDLFTTGNRFDLDKFAKLGSFAVTTWIVVHMEIRQATQEWMVGLYMLAWVGAAYSSIVARIKGQQVQQGAAP